MKRWRYYVVGILFAHLMAAGTLRAQDWTEVFQLQNTLGSCAFFFNANEGVIGTGNYMADIPAQIYYTSDGGATWVQANLQNPSIRGQVTDIFFRDRLHGWAAIKEYVETGWSGIYRSTDGGHTWTRMLQAEFPVGIRETSRGVFYTDRDLDPGVIFSSDTGKTWTNIATTQNALGIDFMDDATGFVTTQATSDLCPHLLTTDSGNTWRGIATSSEAWTPYGDPVSRTFFIASERDPLTYSTETAVLQLSLKATVENRIRTYGDSGLSGGIAGFHGCQSVIYVQGREPASNSPNGCIRTTNAGMTWNSIGGPSNINDKRFAVTGRGAVVFAFDNNGGVWRTMDGGDGTLSSSILADLRIGQPKDTTRTQLCDSAIIPITLGYTACDSVQVVGFSFPNDSLGELHASAADNFSRFVSTSRPDTLSVVYQPQSARSWNATIEIILRQADGYIEDTIIRVPLAATAASAILAISGSNSGTIFFDSTSICSNAYKTVSLRNSGCGNLAVDSIWTIGNPFELVSNAKPFVLTHGDSRSFLFLFTPDTIGKSSGTLCIQTQSGIDSTPLAAIAYSSANRVQLSVPDTISAANCDSMSFTDTLQNIACSALAIDSIMASGPFRITALPAGDSIPPNANIPIGLEFAPNGVGTQTGSIRLAFSFPGAGNYDTTFPISAIGTTGASSFRVSKDSLPMGTVPVCSSELFDTLLVRSSGCGDVSVLAAFDSSNGFSLIRAPKPVLASVDSDTVIIEYQPENILGIQSSYLIFSTSDGSDTVPVSITVAASGGTVELQATPILPALTCQSSTFSFSITNGLCDSLILDSLSLTGDVSEFSIDDSLPMTLAPQQSLSISGIFSPRDSVVYILNAVLAAHDASGTIRDTTISLHADGIAVPPIEVALGATSFAAGIGGTITIPIVAKSSSTAPLDSLDFSLDLNTDLLTPILINSNGTFGNAIVKTIDILSPSSAAFHLKFSQSAMLQAGELCELVCQPFVTRSSSTPIALHSAAFHDGNGSDVCLTTETVPDSIASFTFIPTCGDSLLSQFLLTGSLAIERIVPNPTSGLVHLTFFVPNGYGSDSRIEVYNALGQTLSETAIEFPPGAVGEQSFDLDLNAASGNYSVAGMRYLRIVTPQGSTVEKVLLLPDAELR